MQGSELPVQLSLPRNLRWKLKHIPGTAYTVLRGNRNLPCRHGSVRVKIKEPGKYVRTCGVCKRVWWYGLEVGRNKSTGSVEGRGVLIMRWLSEEELREWEAEEMEELGT